MKQEDIGIAFCANEVFDLGEGFILRRATPGDTERLVAFHSAAMSWVMGMHVEEWMRGDHPANDSAHFALIENTRTSAIVSAACLIPQTLQYEGFSFEAGRWEVVATDPNYRRRGLVRKLFAALHAWSEQQGQLAQIVEGATWLYRRIGYTLALENTGGMNSGGQVCYLPQVPTLSEGQPEPYRVRPAESTDLAFIANLYNQSRKRYLLTSEEPLSHWEYLLRGGSTGYNKWYDLRVIENETGERVGFVMHDPWGVGKVMLYEVAPNHSWLAVTPSVLRAVFGECRRVAQVGVGDCLMLQFGFGSAHPLYTVAPHWLSDAGHPLAGWCVRVPDMPRFLRRIQSVLERRIAQSPVANHNAELRLNFYTEGVLLRIGAGKVIAIETWLPQHERDGDATMTQDNFLAILFGYRSLAQIHANDPDCWVASNEAQVLLETLFPKKHSHLGPLA